MEFLIVYQVVFVQTQGEFITCRGTDLGQFCCGILIFLFFSQHYHYVIFLININMYLLYTLRY